MRKIQRAKSIEVSWGGDWYTNAKYKGEKSSTHRRVLAGYVGHYPRNENPWIAIIHIVLVKGRLMIDGMMPLEAAGDRFNLRDEPHSPEGGFSSARSSTADACD